ncbi:hypothetical protein K1719_002458 [Acacia pycnantha]|nr:hypothetical protein K1719_002458 [Acacia pycnantha]
MTMSSDRGGGGTEDGGTAKRTKKKGDSNNPTYVDDSSDKDCPTLRVSQEEYELRCAPWRKSLRADVQEKIAAWVRIPQLPLEFFNTERLRRIGSLIGRNVED